MVDGWLWLTPGAGSLKKAGAKTFVRSLARLLRKGT